MTDSEGKTPICKTCGKPISNAKTIAGGAGHRCQIVSKTGGKSHYVRVEAQPANTVKISDLHRKIDGARSSIPGLNPSKMVKAIGTDRGINPPAHPIATVYSVNGVRYVSQWLMTDPGLKAIATGDWSKAPTSKK